MKELLKKDSWSPYTVGASIGILLTTMMTLGYQIGVSSGISRISLLIEKAIIPTHAGSTSYLKKILSESVIFDWKVLFVIGLLIGAFIAHKLGPKKQIESNTYWEGSFGASKQIRNTGAFLGGFLLLFGARLADGCTSGHAISGGAQLSAVSWAFMMAVFITAIPTAFILYSRK